MTESVRQVMANYIASIGIERVALSMGYSPRSLSLACERIFYVVNDARLGLDQASYDFRYSNSEFLHRLAEVSGVNKNTLTNNINDIERQIAEERRVYRAWIFVETGFKRSCQPIFVLACLEPQRRLRLDIDSCRLSQPALLERASALIKTHYSDSGGELSLWGVIQCYKLIFAPAQQAVFSCDGLLKRMEPVQLSSFASISL